MIKNQIKNIKRRIQKMANYARGFVVDTPKAFVKTTSGDVQIYKATSGEVKIGAESLEISGGWSPFALAEIDTKQNLEITMSDTILQLDTLKLTTGGTVTTAATQWYNWGDSHTIGVAATPTITISDVVIASSIRINGFTEVASSPTATQFVVVIGATDTTVTFNSAAAGTVVYPAYLYATAATTQTLAVTSENFAKSGEVYVEFPFYGDEVAAGSQSQIAGYIQIKIYNARIRADMTIGGSAKTASSFQVALKGLDAGRSDKKIYEVGYKFI
jgi:hypothetical protein